MELQSGDGRGRDTNTVYKGRKLSLINLCRMCLARFWPGFDSQHEINCVQWCTRIIPALITGGSEVQGHSQLCSKIEFTLGYLKPCLKERKKERKEGERGRKGEKNLLIFSWTIIMV